MKSVLNFIAEAGMLKQIKRTGWLVLGISSPESVAEHAFRCAVLGYVLAHLEKASTGKVLLMTLFNDIHEARIGDLHKMAQRYIDLQAAENRAFQEQIMALPPTIKKELGQMRKEYLQQKSKESIIARDTDILECLIQAKEYYEQGFSQAIKFMRQAPGFLKTKSAQRLWRLASKTKVSDWWQNLSRFKR